MKNTFYFSHDYNCRLDGKIKNMIRKNGIEGYGIYWAIIEDLYNNANALQMDCEGIAYDLRTSEEKVRSILNDFDLFIIENNIISSEGVKKRLKEREKKSKKAKQSALKRRYNKEKTSDANALQTQYDSNAIKERKGKEKKGKEDKKNYGDFVKLKETEYNNLISDYGKNIIESKIEDMNNYCGSIGKKYKDYNLALRQWIKKDGTQKIGDKSFNSPLQGNIGKLTGRI